MAARRNAAGTAGDLKLSVLKKILSFTKILQFRDRNPVSSREQFLETSVMILSFLLICNREYRSKTCAGNSGARYRAHSMPNSAEPRRNTHEI